MAQSPASRLAMAMSVLPGHTTEQAFMTRWGPPVQKVRDGGQTEFIYRDMSEANWYQLPQFGDSSRYVIVTFQYGLATAVRTSDGIACRAAFNPRPPNYAFDLPVRVDLVGMCPFNERWPTAAESNQSKAAPNGGLVPDDSARVTGQSDGTVK